MKQADTNFTREYDYTYWNKFTRGDKIRALEGLLLNGDAAKVKQILATERDY